MHKEFGHRIRDLRIKKGLTQDGLAIILGVSRSTVTKYETGEREPDYIKLQLLADYFETTIDYLLGYKFTPSQKTSKDLNEKELISLVKAVGKLTPEDVKQLKKVAKTLFPYAFK